MAFHFGLVLEHWRREEKLRQREKRFQGLLENALDFITVLDQDGTLRHQSPWVESVLGYRSRELVGQSLFAYVHPEDVSEVVGLFGRLRQNPGGVEAGKFRFRHGGGSWLILEALGKVARPLGPGGGRE